MLVMATPKEPNIFLESVSLLKGASHVIVELVYCIHEGWLCRLNRVSWILWILLFQVSMQPCLLCWEMSNRLDVFDGFIRPLALWPGDTDSNDDRE